MCVRFNNQAKLQQLCHSEAAARDSRGRGRRVKRGGGLASATREEIEDLKWQERKDWDHPGTYGA